jgi:hypothetical protein
LELKLILADEGIEQAVQDKANELHTKFMSLAEGVLERKDAERTVKAAYEPLLSTLEHSAGQGQQLSPLDSVSNRLRDISYRRHAVRKADTLEQKREALGHVIECLISYYKSRLGDVGTQDDDKADEVQHMVLTYLKSQVTCFQGRQKGKELRERYQVVMDAKRARKVCLEKLGRIQTDRSKS